jgi:hypothetical protein
MESIVDIFKFWKDTIFGIIGVKSKPTPAQPQPVTMPIAPAGPWQAPSFLLPPAPVVSSYAPLLVAPAPTLSSPIAVNQSSGIFNPNMIISNKEFLDCSSLTEKQIQDFIAFKGSFLKDYPINDHLTSYWIYKHCNDLGLNPKVLMTNIQKEQATITMKVMPKNKRRLDYFCGVGAYDPPKGDDPKWSGVDKQILGAVQVNTRRYQKALALKFPYAFITDKPELRKLQIQNAATMSLYNYTPFVGDETLMIGKNKYEKPFGNAFFWYIYNKWFGFTV